MAEHDWLAAQFEEHRARLRAVAYRMLGSLSEADDAVQEAWLRLSRARGRIDRDPRCGDRGQGSGERGERAAQPALVNGAIGVVVAPRGRLLMVLRFTIMGGTIVAIDTVTGPERLGQLDLALLTD